jgi:hypothetical protein
MRDDRQAPSSDADVSAKRDAGVEPGTISLSERSADAVGQVSGGLPRERGQGFQLDQEVKAATEAHAMTAAIEFYGRGWEVRDVHATKSYDLSCHRAGEERHVEVKGTTTDGAEVILTPGEVAHARTYPHPALFILKNINIDRAEDGTIKASGGEPILLDPWNIAAGTLVPLAYKYHVPPPTDAAKPCGSRSVPRRIELEHMNHAPLAVPPDRQRAADWDQPPIP